ncbi:ABC transporter D family member 1-like [Gossypium australe]|uniref:ABC transporter D family member 1-like n=1 Tax=Gossypium australe TaxID=47621 RepID=A0A5B6UH26_9ROSI|nr:ABC transporter D family member 1-like [Gossypium australe]
MKIYYAQHPPSGYTGNVTVATEALPRTTSILSIRKTLKTSREDIETLIVLWSEKILLLGSGIVAAGGAVAYLQSRFSSKKPDSHGHCNGTRDKRENSDKVLKRNNHVKRTRKKKGGLKSLQVLVAFLLSKMGKVGARDLLALVGTVVLRTALSNRLAKVQGFLFRAVFLQNVPSFFRLISENILLSFLLSTIHSTSKYVTGILSLRFRKILTKLIHAHYFEVEYIGYADRIHELMLISRELSADDKKASLQKAGSMNYLTEANFVEFSSVKVVTPTGNVLVKDLSLRVESGSNLLITGFFLENIVPTVFDKQGAQLLAVAFLVATRTWLSDQIATLNGTTVKYVLEQDKAGFIRLMSISVLQSAASAVIAPSLRHLTATLALGWRIRLTQHLLKNYLRNNAFYQVFQMSSKNIDADQRITDDLEKLTTDLSGLVTGMVKPSVDILWFTWRMKLLTGRRGVSILYAYMLLGLGLLRTATPDFGDLASREQQLEGTFRFMHERLRTHAESIAFFGGGAREKAMVESRFRDLLDHSSLLLKKKWQFGILDDFVTKQFPHIVTWGLSLLYTLDHKGDRSSVSTQIELGHGIRFLASVVSQSFLAFGDIMELNRKFLELSGSINRVFELEELVDAVQSGDLRTDKVLQSHGNDLYAEDVISFCDVDIVTPSEKLLARQLTCDVVPGKNLLVTGPNGSGKSSVFRVLRGLWPVMSGRLYKPSHHLDKEDISGCGVFYVPQKPYTCLGTLRDQIIYPLSHEEAKLKELKLYGKGKSSADTTNILDARLKNILENVRLNYLLERDESGWDANLSWEDILSLGEQQRLGIARLFFHKPKFGILDECTNATSVDVEEQLYRLAKHLGITVITSSQASTFMQRANRPALIPFHALELRFVDGEGNWELRSIEQ